MSQQHGQRAHYSLHRVAVISLRAAAAVLIGATLLVMGMRLSGNELLSVQTDSMAPTVRAGEAVVVAAADRDIAPGEVVSFSSPQNPRVTVTHRVISVDWDRGTFIARGDRNNIADGPVPMRNLHGTVHQVVPLAGYALDALRHPLGIIIAVYVPALGIIAAEVRRLSVYFAGNSGRGQIRRVRYVLHVRAH